MTCEGFLCHLAQAQEALMSVESATTICEFCKEPMNAGATVCPHCRKPTRSARSRKARVIWTWILVPLGLFVAFVVIVNVASPPESDPAARIKSSCERQFGVDTTRANECRIQLSTEYLSSADRDEMDRARSRAR